MFDWTVMSRMLSFALLLLLLLFGLEPLLQGSKRFVLALVSLIASPLLIYVQSTKYKCDVAGLMGIGMREFGG